MAIEAANEHNVKCEVDVANRVVKVEPAPVAPPVEMSARRRSKQPMPPEPAPDAVFDDGDTDGSGNFELLPTKPAKGQHVGWLKSP